jgi:hypothetical protein
MIIGLDGLQGRARHEPAHPRLRSLEETPHD